jgi:hypothetical protein
MSPQASSAANLNERDARSRLKFCAAIYSIISLFQRLNDDKAPFILPILVQKLLASAMPEAPILILMRTSGFFVEPASLGPAPSLGLKLFIEAQASSSVPSG